MFGANFGSYDGTVRAQRGRARCRCCRLTLPYRNILRSLVLLVLGTSLAPLGL